MIISCDDLNVYAFNLIDGPNINFNVTLTSAPLALKAFDSTSIIAIGDKNTGKAYIFKYNLD